MVDLKDELVFGSLFRTYSGLVFHHVVIFLLLTHFYGVQLQTTGPHQPVIVMVGDDVVLPYHLEPRVDAGQMTIEWGRPDLEPRFVSVWLNGKELLTDQNSAYKGRATLSTSQMKQGDVSLRLSNVTISDNGFYRCYIPEQNKEYFVELVVGSVSSPQINLSGLDASSSGVVLECECKGWYPEPEVLWLDGEGNVLSAGPTETVRGPDDLYTVSSRVTVDKRHGNTFTCRVQQTNINQMRDTHMHIPDDFFMTSSSCAAPVAFSVLFALMFILTVSVFVWKWKQNKTVFMLSAKNTDKEDGITDKDETTDQLMTENKMLEHLEKKKTKLDEELQRTKEEQKDLDQTLITLTEVMKELKKQKEKLRAETDEPLKQAEEIDKKIKSVDEEVNKKEGDKMINKGHGYLKLKEIFQEFNYKLNDIKKEQQSLHMINDQMMKMICDEINRITERKKETEKHMEQIQQQLKETDTQREKILYRGNMNQ